MKAMCQKVILQFDQLIELLQSQTTSLDEIIRVGVKEV